MKRLLRMLSRRAESGYFRRRIRPPQINRSAVDPAAGDVPVTDVRIFQPSKTAMQSGRRATQHWMLQFERDAPQVADPLMGWMGSRDTRPQLRLTFESREEAIAFAERNGLTYSVQEPHAPALRPKSYAENFRA
ncbi:MAG TPA: ETC complex I subunit [Rhodospirillales bacterium]|nr:ETC complex I subunit [Rhodospirillales bacterium]